MGNIYSILFFLFSSRKSYGKVFANLFTFIYKNFQIGNVDLLVISIPYVNIYLYIQAPFLFLEVSLMKLPRLNQYESN